MVYDMEKSMDELQQLMMIFGWKELVELLLFGQSIVLKL